MFYKNIYEFEDILSSYRHITTNIDVSAGYLINIGGHIIYNDSDVIDNIKVKKTKIISNTIETLKRINIDTSKVSTSSYENLTYNKTKYAIELFNNLDKLIIELDPNIKRRYMEKYVAYSTRKNFLKVIIKQKSISLYMLNDQNNMNDLITIPDGHNSPLCKRMDICEESSIIEAISYIQSSYFESKIPR